MDKRMILREKKFLFLSLDSLEITADLYKIENNKAPYIILFHQANFSRGSYLDIAPKLNKLWLQLYCSRSPFRT